MRAAKVDGITIVLPFKLPTWNQLFAMNRWERQKVTNWIKEYVSTCIRDAGGSQIPMGSVLRPQLTVLQEEAYSAMIQPNTSKVYRSRKRLAKTKR